LRAHVAGAGDGDVSTRLRGGTTDAIDGMHVRLHPHTLSRMRERRATESEVLATIESGERFAAPFGRTGFRKRFRATRGRGPRELSALAESHDDAWLVVTVVVTSGPRKRRAS
jgi:hypothetical protein